MSSCSLLGSLAIFNCKFLILREDGIVSTGVEKFIHATLAPAEEPLAANVKTHLLVFAH